MFVYESLSDFLNEDLGSLKTFPIFLLSGRMRFFELSKVEEEE